MPEHDHEAKSRDERLLALYQTTQETPRLGTIGPTDFETLSMEFVMMKLYAIKLEQKIITVLDELRELIPEELLPKEQQPTAEPEKEPDHGDDYEDSADGPEARGEGG